jgi:branched-chain amino acid transport system permease protein
MCLRLHDQLLEDLIEEVPPADVGLRRISSDLHALVGDPPPMRRPAAGASRRRASMMTTHVVNVVTGGLFHAAILFLVAAGLQVVFGVQKIFNLACGSFYALGAYVGVSAVQAFVQGGGPPALFVLPLVAAGLLIGLVGIVVERGLLRFIYDRDETFQLLLTFAVVLMLEDLIRMTWGAAPTSTSGLYLIYGQIHLLGATIPTYNLIVIGASIAIAAGIGWLTRTASGGSSGGGEPGDGRGGGGHARGLRAVFTRPRCPRGALVIPATAAMSEMGIELIVEAFAVVVIGGLGSMRGALVGALVVGVLRSVAISVYPEIEMLLIYLIVIAVLLLRPRGLFGGAAA